MICEERISAFRSLCFASQGRSGNGHVDPDLILSQRVLAVDGGCSDGELAAERSRVTVQFLGFAAKMCRLILV
jgi:hypothetical protein